MLGQAAIRRKQADPEPGCGRRGKGGKCCAAIAHAPSEAEAIQRTAELLAIKPIDRKDRDRHGGLLDRRMLEAVEPEQEFWPGGARLVISISMQFEAGGQPAKGTDSPFPKVDFPAGVASDPAANSWFAYGYREGVPRMLDLWDRHGVKVTSHMNRSAHHALPRSAR